MQKLTPFFLWLCTSSFAGATQHFPEDSFLACCHFLTPQDLMQVRSVSQYHHSSVNKVFHLQSFLHIQHPVLWQKQPHYPLPWYHGLLEHTLHLAQTQFEAVQYQLDTRENIRDAFALLNLQLESELSKLQDTTSQLVTKKQQLDHVETLARKWLELAIQNSVRGSVLMKTAECLPEQSHFLIPPNDHFDLLSDGLLGDIPLTLDQIVRHSCSQIPDTYTLFNTHNNSDHHIIDETYRFKVATQRRHYALIPQLLVSRTYFLSHIVCHELFDTPQFFEHHTPLEIGLQSTAVTTRQHNLILQLKNTDFTHPELDTFIQNILESIDWQNLSDEPQLSIDMIYPYLAQYLARLIQIQTLEFRKSQSYQRTLTSLIQNIHDHFPADSIEDLSNTLHIAPATNEAATFLEQTHNRLLQLTSSHHNITDLHAMP